LENLFQFNRRVLSELKIQGRKYVWGSCEVVLAPNPKLGEQPVLLVPLDTLRALPIATDWDGVMDAASHNDALRSRINLDIGNIWAFRTRADKAKIRQEALRSKRSFEAIIAMINAAKKTPYNFTKDPEGEIFWRRLLARLAQTEPLAIDRSDSMNSDHARGVVEKIIGQFRHLIEDRRYSAELYKDDGSPRHEKAAQRFFFAVADCYCKANNLDITPEADTGAGNIDFKFSLGYECRILVEIKLSTNARLIEGFANQITAYNSAERAIGSYYVVIDVGHMGNKDSNLTKLKNNWTSQDKPVPELCFIDGSIRPPASKLTARQ
jgi:hypothetical protein